MKKVALSAAVILAFIFYGLHQRQEDSSAQVIIPSDTSLAFATPTDTPTDTPTPTPTADYTSSGSTPTPTPKPTRTPTPTPKPSGQYKDGTYTGSVADAFYGNIQVRAHIQNGRLTAVDILQYPNDRGNSIEINQQALPYLQREAIATQSAQVNTVSGASDSSQAFRESLAAALNQAK